MKVEKYENIEQLINGMKELYCEIQIGRMVLLNKKASYDIVLTDKLRNQLANTVDSMIEQFNDIGKYEFLKNRIEELLKDDSGLEETHKKIKDTYESYYKYLLKKADELKEKLNLYRYGDFVKLEQNPQIIYKDKNITIIELERYKTKKTKENEDIHKNQQLEEEKLSKYEFSLNKELEDTQSVSFIGETSLEEILKSGDLKQFASILEAVKKANMLGRKHIGRLRFNSEKNIFDIEYDDNLEASVKRLFEIENNKSEKEEHNGNLENLENRS